MKHYREFTATQMELESITCDKCHTEYDDVLELQEFLSINFTGGYNSIFGDTNTVMCDICQYCLKDMIGDICRVEDGNF
jgi:hypothetical protein